MYRIEMDVKYYEHTAGKRKAGSYLEEYDEYELLILAMGRCAQDDYYLVSIDEKDLPEEISKRFATKIEDVLPLEDYGLLVFFRDGIIKKCDLKDYFEKTQTFQILLKSRNILSMFKCKPEDLVFRGM